MNESKNVNYSQVLNINGFTNTDNNLFVYDKALDEVFEYSSIPLKYPPFLSDFINRITSTDTYHISNEEKETFAAYMALQIERTITFTGNLDNKGILDVQLKEMGYDFRNLDTEEALLDCFVKGKKKELASQR